MTDMIEIVARAMADAPWDVASNMETPSGEDPEEFREYWRDKARAAIEAMREPTDAMVSAGIIERHDQPCPEAWNLATQHIWQSMIDAALIVQPGGLERG